MIYRIESKTWLPVILVLAFLVRLPGLNYALPLQVVGDEATSIFGALKMMELKTLLPVLHLDEFKPLLYYPPYLSYLYLPFFGLFLSFKFLFFGGNLEEFKTLLIADPSALFLMARLLSAIFGVLTVWLVYKIGKNIFKSEAPALLSAGFLALSFLHVNFSHWARHWIPATFFFALVFYFLSREDFSPRRKYLWALAIAGLGAGINYQVALAAFFIVLWFLFYDRLSLRAHLKASWVYLGAILFLGLAFLPFLLYPPGLVVSAESALSSAHAFAGFIGAYVFYLVKLLETEPVLLLFFVVGMVYLFRDQRGYFGAAGGFVLLYVAVFYFFFFIVERYILMLYPILALGAGWGLYRLYLSSAPKFKPAVLALGALSFLFMLAVSLRLDFILLKNDTRLEAIRWVKINVPERSKVVVLASLTHLPTLPAALAEQEKIDPGSLRKRDLAELRLPDKFLFSGRYHALNLYAANSRDFFGGIGDYLRTNKYEYAVFSPEFARLRGAGAYFDAAGSRLETFKGFAGGDDDLTNGFGGGLGKIFALEQNGPEMVISRLDP
ncbi:glycosyltransferase family 39 protein [Candidatus Giovannonibacteria bacterium]|nr:glycosyltransferase family 39 protein [Candidatus Giovannonibacteria bacterium]